ncbi:hypothetical protein [Bacillus marasmi]|uniref:YfjL-like protein n=1 Tax=Bacillus marasmi TaxID=1926279 RepID=UPI0011C8F4EC|nr:hypothetical protein [Bacillus marasmi]
MKLKKLIVLILTILILAVVVFFLNTFFGNPISKAKAKKEVLAFYEEKYNKEFEVYSARYNFLIPDYNITMGPIDDKNAVFETSRYELTMYDSYGAYLATDELQTRISKVLEKQYPNLKFKLLVQEEHHIEVAGIEFDFFSKNKETRLETNYFLVELTLDDAGLSDEEPIKVMDEMAKLINTELNGTPKQLSLDIYVGDNKDDVNSIHRSYINGRALVKY